MDRSKRERYSEISSHYIREYAYQNGDNIYDWMKKNGIGESEYGKYLDSLGRDKGFFNHRLYGHQPLYDFPFEAPENIPDFLEHILISDLFTKQGLPIIPGEIIKDQNLKPYFNSIGYEWNFMNGFDLLASSLAVYNNYKLSLKYFKGEVAISTIDELAKHIGVSGIHIALALHTCNPLLVISSLISMGGAIAGTTNSNYRIYFNKVARMYSVDKSEKNHDPTNIVGSYDANNVVEGYDPDKY
ncbi:MAG: hypothetical protein RLN83_07855 [Balneola sp.]|tara:strand:+ start:19085 stop:19813 length:729 start_codon:yes stop_codon:yes gene_type:complete